jgi:hypothetical protein
VSEVGLTPIPWRFQDSALAQMWQWTTPHFQVTVTAEQQRFYWELGDLIMPNQGLPRFLAEGWTNGFDAAEREVREAVGKSYPPLLGYGAYAGALATTFTIATGERINLGEFNGQQVLVTVRLANGLDQTIVGYASVVHYELHIDPPTGGAMKIQPSHIVREGGGSGAKSNNSYLGIGRMYRGTVTRSCTGKPGYMPNTIDHTGSPCPAHEETLKKFAVTPLR